MLHKMHAKGPTGVIKVYDTQCSKSYIVAVVGGRGGSGGNWGMGKMWELLCLATRERFLSQI